MEWTEWNGMEWKEWKKEGMVSYEWGRNGMKWMDMEDGGNGRNEWWKEWNGRNGMIWSGGMEWNGHLTRP